MRLLGLEEIPHALRQALGQLLRVSDEATVLPSASRSTESGAFKYVVMRLSGTDGELNPDLFSSIGLGVWWRWTRPPPRPAARRGAV